MNPLFARPDPGFVRWARQLQSLSQWYNGDILRERMQEVRALSAWVDEMIAEVDWIRGMCLTRTLGRR